MTNNDHYGFFQKHPELKQLDMYLSFIFFKKENLQKVIEFSDSSNLLLSQLLSCEIQLLVTEIPQMYLALGPLLWKAEKK